MATISRSEINFGRGAICPHTLIVVQTGPDTFLCAYRDDGPDLCGIRDRAPWSAAEAWIEQAHRAGLTIERHVEIERQAEMPGTAPDIGGLLRTKATAPIMPAKPQKPCDVGLFSDDAGQLKLV